jgi:predicted small lipoprotein YifL
MLAQRACIAIFAAIFLFAVSGCGQIGPLTLPEDSLNGAEEPDDEDDER